MGSPCAGHPEYGHAGGIETTTGPLGQGIANAVGMAIAERHLNARFGNDLVDHRTYVIASDGDLMEGISHEAISLAGHLKLNRLIVLFDDNSITIDGATSLSDNTDTIERFQAAGWNTVNVNGHDAADVGRALAWAQKSDKPVLIACKTIIGYGLPTRQGTQKAHSDAPGAEEIAGARKELNWPSPPFVIPDDILADWRAIGARGKPVARSMDQARGVFAEGARLRCGDDRRCSGRCRLEPGRAEREDERREARHRDAQGVGSGAGSDQCGLAARPSAVRRTSRHRTTPRPSRSIR